MYVFLDLSVARVSQSEKSPCGCGQVMHTAEVNGPINDKDRGAQQPRRDLAETEFTVYNLRFSSRFITEGSIISSVLVLNYLARLCFRWTSTFRSCLINATKKD